MIYHHTVEFIYFSELRGIFGNRLTGRLSLSKN